MSATELYRDETIAPQVPVVAARGVRLPAPDRGEDLVLRIVAPTSGDQLPVVLFSHGYGSSMDGYAPLADHWAAAGYVVIQPTYLDAKRLALSPDDPRRPTIWRQRVADARSVLDNLPTLEGAVPGLAGRIERDRIAAAGHSFGGQTTSLLLGARMAADGGDEDMRDERVAAGILLASGGRGGGDLSDFGRQYTPYLDMRFDRMTTPSLVVVGDRDDSPLTTRGPDWFADPYLLAPGAKALLTLHGGEHMLGGISGYDVTETTDEDPARVALVQRATTGFLDAALRGDAAGWRALQNGLGDDPAAAGRIDER